jgi:hypothetical protein
VEGRAAAGAGIQVSSGVIPVTTVGAPSGPVCSVWVGFSRPCGESIVVIRLATGVLSGGEKEGGDSPPTFLPPQTFAVGERGGSSPANEGSTGGPDQLCHASASADCGGAVFSTHWPPPFSLCKRLRSEKGGGQSPPPFLPTSCGSECWVGQVPCFFCHDNGACGRSLRRMTQSSTFPPASTAHVRLVLGAALGAELRAAVQATWAVR